MFKSIGKAIVFVVDGIAKCCAVILVSFGLWLPCLYSIIFFIVKRVAGFAFGGVTQVLFFVGLGISIMSGVVFAMYLKKKKSQKQALQVKNHLEKQKPTTKPKKEKFYKDVRTVQLPPLDEPLDQEVYQPLPPEPPARQAVKQPPTQSAKDYQKKYLNSQSDVDIDEPLQQPTRQTTQPTRQTVQPTEQVIDGGSQQASRSLGADSLWQRLNSASVPDEKPMIFATRSDPNLLVYEYSDRLQFWRKTSKGLVLEQTKFKGK